MSQDEERPVENVHAPEDGQDDAQYPSTAKAAIIMLAVYLSVFLVALVGFQAR